MFSNKRIHTAIALLVTAAVSLGAPSKVDAQAREITILGIQPLEAAEVAVLNSLTSNSLKDQQGHDVKVRGEIIKENKVAVSSIAEAKELLRVQGKAGASLAVFQVKRKDDQKTLVIQDLEKDVTYTSFKNRLQLIDNLQTVLNNRTNNNKYVDIRIEVSQVAKIYQDEILLFKTQPGQPASFTYPVDRNPPIAVELEDRSGRYRTADNPLASDKAVRREVCNRHPALECYQLRYPDDFMRGSSSSNRKLLLAGLSAGLGGIALPFLIAGGRGLAIDGRCYDDMPCARVYDTSRMGLGLTITGAVLLAGAGTLAGFAIDRHLKQRSRSGAPSSAVTKQSEGQH